MAFENGFLNKFSSVEHAVLSVTLSPNSSSSTDNRNLNIFPYKLNLFTNKSVQRCRTLTLIYSAYVQRFTAALSNLKRPSLLLQRRISERRTVPINTVVQDYKDTGFVGQHLIEILSNQIIQSINLFASDHMDPHHNKRNSFTETFRVITLTRSRTHKPIRPRDLRRWLHLRLDCS